MIVTAIAIMTVTDTAATTGLAVDKLFRALRTTCTSTIARQTRAAECNWSSRTATRHAAREKAGVTIAGAFGSIMDAGRIFRSAVRFDSARQEAIVRKAPHGVRPSLMGPSLFGSKDFVRFELLSAWKEMR
jgi:hypothetical protein